MLEPDEASSMPQRGGAHALCASPFSNRRLLLELRPRLPHAESASGEADIWERAPWGPAQRHVRVISCSAVVGLDMRLGDGLRCSAYLLQWLQQKWDDCHRFGGVP